MVQQPTSERTAQQILAEWTAAQAAEHREGATPETTERITALRRELDAAVAREAAQLTAAIEEPTVAPAELRATSDEILRDLDVLAALEEEKRTIVPGDPQMVELAARVDAIAQRVLALTSRQREMTVQHEAYVTSSGSTVPPIEATPPRPIAAILADWRAQERRLAAAEPGSVDAIEASATIDGLRDEYREAYERQARRDAEDRR
jgi:hypothetical protein